MMQHRNMVLLANIVAIADIAAASIAYLGEKVHPRWAASLPMACCLWKVYPIGFALLKMVVIVAIIGKRWQNLRLTHLPPAGSLRTKIREYYHRKEISRIRSGCFAFALWVFRHSGCLGLLG